MPKKLETSVKSLDKRVKNLDTLDIGLIKWSVLVGGVIIIKLFPQLIDINYLVLIVALAVLAIRPVYRFLS